MTPMCLGRHYAVFGNEGKAMKEHLDTIPVLEAFEKESECALCALYHKADAETLRYLLGASYMEEDVREETDKAGFCKQHFRQLCEGNNTLGAALILSTHMAKTERELSALCSDEKLFGNKKGLFAKPERSAMEQKLEEVRDSCFACERIASRMKNYMASFFHLWSTEKEFQARVLAGKGFCLPHFLELLQAGKNHLSGEHYRTFVRQITPLVLDNFRRVREDVLWLIDKYDYRYKDEPWKNAKDSVPRGILKVCACETMMEEAEEK